MIFIRKYHLPVWIAVVVFLLTAFSDVNKEIPKTGFWAMKGTLVTHVFEDKTDSLSGPEIYELLDSTGITIWFGRHIFKDVCISGKCKMIRLWIFWNGTGNYLGHQLLPREPLTKSDHTLFVDADYRKLDNILKDSTSILKRLKQEELIIMPENKELLNVDGYTAATQPTLAEVVVKDAVYSCHTLWHTVYGPVQKNIFEILESRISTEYLTLLFENENPEYISWAIESVVKHPEYHADFYPQIMEFISSENSALANKALSYFQPELLADTVIQLQLIQVIPDSDASIKYEILWKFTGVNQIHPKVVVNLLEMFISQELSIGTYNLILRLITPEHLNDNEQIVQILNILSENENGYIRNMSKKALDEKSKTISK